MFYARGTVARRAAVLGVSGAAGKGGGGEGGGDKEVSAGEGEGLSEYEVWNHD